MLSAPTHGSRTQNKSFRIATRCAPCGGNIKSTRICLKSTRGQFNVKAWEIRRNLLSKVQAAQEKRVRTPAQGFPRAGPAHGESGCPQYPAIGLPALCPRREPTRHSPPIPHRCIYSNHLPARRPSPDSPCTDSGTVLFRGVLFQGVRVLRSPVSSGFRSGVSGFPGLRVPR